MIYLLDGYNILFREKDIDGSFEEQRIQLFDKLNGLADASCLNFIVVLDAHQQVGEMERHHYYSLEVVYTDFNQTADDYIIEYVQCLALNKRCQIKVVSSDRTLMQKVRCESVEVLSVADFYKEVEKKSKSRRVKRAVPQQSPPYIPIKRKAPLLDDTASWVALFEARSKEK